jgi:alpha-L-fucosidase
VRIHITKSRLEPTLAEMGLFKQPAAFLPPVISDRDAKGMVTLQNDRGLKMVYTFDGSAPTPHSAVYSTPISMPLDGTVKAACLLPDGKLGIEASKSFAGMMPVGWKVVEVDSQEINEQANNAAANAIDDNSSTFWHTRWNSDLKLPHFITVDMGTSHRIGGFIYLPRQDNNANGTVQRYRFETSSDGVNWTTNIASGTFANIWNNPSLQKVTFTPVDARFFRFTALQEIYGNGWTSAAEISVLPYESDKGPRQ